MLCGRVGGYQAALHSLPAAAFLCPRRYGDLAASLAAWQAVLEGGSGALDRSFFNTPLAQFRRKKDQPGFTPAPLE